MECVYMSFNYSNVNELVIFVDLEPSNVGSEQQNMNMRSELLS